jgi:chromatin segregation and condensation protein Rec8/ScpA/Scc1 (kleisin family)
MACAELLEDDRSTEAPEEADAAPAEADTLEIRKELRRQIAQLEAELASYVRDLPPGELPTAPPWAEGHIADIEELEEIRDVLVTKLFRARKSAMDRAKRESEARRGAQKRSAEGPLTRVMSRWRDSMDK